MRKAKSIALATLAVLTLIVASAAIPLVLDVERAFADWDGPLFWRHTVDSVGDVGEWTSIAFDSTGRPGIAYYDATNRDLKLARWNGLSWDNQTVDDSVGLWTMPNSLFVSLAYDVNDRPGIAYYDGADGNGKLQYAHWNGSAWDVETVESAAGTGLGLFPSLAYDASGAPAVSYSDTNEGLKYAHWNESSWNIEVVDSSTSTEEYTSLAFDDAGNQGIAYYHRETGSLKYAHWNGSLWDVGIVEAGSDVGRYASLVYGHRGKPHIAYYDYFNTAVKHAWYDGSWRTMWVDGVDWGQDVGEYASMVAHDDGGLTIAYYDGTDDKVKVARQDPGSTWKFFTPDPQVATGKFSSAAGGPNGGFGVSYYDEGSGDLKYFFVDSQAPAVVFNEIPDFVNTLSLVNGGASDDSFVDDVRLRIEDTAAGQYWNGSSWVEDETWLDPDTHSVTWSMWSYDSSGISFDDGSAYALTARAMDKVERTSSLVTVTFNFDTTNPVATVDDIDDFVNSLTSIGGTAADTPPGQVQKVQLQIRNVNGDEYWNGNLWISEAIWLDATGAASWTYDTGGTGWTDGDSYEVTARSTDKAGNTSAEVSQSFVYDATSPTATIDDIPDFVNSLTSVSGTAADSSPGQVERIQVQLTNDTSDTYWDGSEWQAIPTWLDASGTVFWTYPLPVLEEGDYTVKARSIDGAGNISSEASDSFGCDTTGPTVAVDNVDAFLNTLTSVSGTAADDRSGVDAVIILIRNNDDDEYWDGDSWESGPTWLSCTGATSWSRDAGGVVWNSDRSYTVTAKSVDQAGNVSGEASMSFIYDSTDPTIELTDIPDFVVSLTSISGTAADTSPGQLERVQLQINSSDTAGYWNGSDWQMAEVWVNVTGTTFWSYDTSGVSWPDGYYTIKARSADKAGNISSEALDGFGYDTTDPTVTLDDLPDFANLATVISGMAADIVGVSKVQVRLQDDTTGTYWDGGQWQATATWLDASGTSSWTFPMPVVADGDRYTVKARSVDNLGRESNQVSGGFIFDGTGPTVTMAEIPDKVVLLPFLSGTASDTSPGELEKVQVQIMEIASGTYWSGSSWQLTSAWVDASGTTSWTYDTLMLDHGDYVVSARSVDKAGNISSHVSDSFDRDATGPTVTIDGVNEFTNSLTSVTGTAADNKSGIAAISLLIRDDAGNQYWGGDSWESSQTWLGCGSATLWSYDTGDVEWISGHSYTVTARALDNHGNTTAPGGWPSATFTFDTASPAVILNEIPDVVTSFPLIGGTAADDPSGELEKVQVQLMKVAGSTYWDGSAWQAKATWMDAAGTMLWTYVTPALEGESYIIKTRSVDKAGNISFEVADSFVADAISPTVTIEDIGDFVNSFPVMVGTAGDIPPGELDRVQLQIRKGLGSAHWNGTGWQADPVWIEASGTVFWTYTLPVFEDENYSVKARSIDKAGNLSSEVSDVFIYDTSAPAGYGPSTPQNRVTGVSIKPTLASLTAFDVTPHIVRVMEEIYEYYYFQMAEDVSFVEGLQESGWQAASGWSPPGLLLADTKYYWRVKVKDDLGNEAGWSNTSEFTTVATTMISAGRGGRVEGLDGKVKINLPGDAVNGDVQLYVLPAATSPGDAPPRYALGETFFVIEAFATDGTPVTTLNSATTIVVRYSDDDVAVADGDPSRIQLAYWDEETGTWQQLPTSIDTGNQTAKAITTHLSVWGLLVAPPPEEGMATWARMLILVDAALVMITCGLIIRRQVVAVRKARGRVRGVDEQS